MFLLIHMFEYSNSIADQLLIATILESGSSQRLLSKPILADAPSSLASAYSRLISTEIDQANCISPVRPKPTYFEGVNRRTCAYRSRHMNEQLAEKRFFAHSPSYTKSTTYGIGPLKTRMRQRNKRTMREHGEESFWGRTV